MASKQHIKETINVLCKVIAHNGGTKITPEVFRLAKFDKNEVTGAMWTLLFETVCYLNFKSFRAPKDLGGETNPEITLLAKQELFERGYYVQEFYLLPEDMSYGSREILLTFGWLTSKSKLLHLFLDNCNNIFEECLPIGWKSLISPNPLDSESSNSISRNVSLEASMGNISSWDQLSWIVGNLTLSYKGLFTAGNQLAALVDKVHSSTQGTETTKGHLSALEVYLLRHPRELTQFLEKMQLYNTYLESLLRFVELQDIFWKWLQSVFEAKMLESKDSGQSQWSDKEPCRTCCEIFNERLSHLWSIQAEIHKVMTDNKNQISDDEESICQIKLQDVNKKLVTLTFGERPSSLKQPKMQTFPELRCIPTSSNIKQAGKSCAQKKMDVLKGKFSELELELLELRNEHFDILNDLVGNLEDSVFIPPIGKSKYKELRHK